MNIFITGGTGFVGAALCRQLQAQGHQITVLSRRVDQVPHLCGEGIEAVSDVSALATDRAFDVVINLAGEPIADRRWSDKRKRRLYDSRIALTRSVVAYMKSCAVPPPLMISASAIGFYGDQGEQQLTESAAAVDDFAHRLCRDWEREALAAETLGTRVCVLRIGLVMGRDGGMLKKMALPFRLGLGGPLGSGQQWMSWVHRDDLIAMIEFIMTHQTMRGIYNATAPQPVTNNHFTQTLAKQYHRSARFRVPAALLRCALGELATLLLGGQRVVPERLLQEGFTFRYPDLEQALAQACSS